MAYILTFLMKAVKHLKKKLKWYYLKFIKISKKKPEIITTKLKPKTSKRCLGFWVFALLYLNFSQMLLLIEIMVLKQSN